MKCERLKRWNESGASWFSLSLLASFFSVVRISSILLSAWEGWNVSVCERVCMCVPSIQRDFMVVLLSNAPAVSRQQQKAVGQKEAEGETATLKER